MNSLKVVTESEWDALFLSALLPPSLRERVDIRSAGGFSAVASLARSFAAKGAAKVALIIDSGSNDPLVASERKTFLESSLREVAPGGKAFVSVIQPQVEALLFESRSAIRELLGRDISDDEFYKGRYEPKAILRKYSRGGLNEIRWSDLSDSSLERIRSDKDVKGLLEFLDH